MTVVRGVHASDLEPAGVVQIVRRAIGLYYRNFGVLACLSLLFGGLPACILLAFGVSPYGDPDLLDLGIVAAVGSISGCFLSVAFVIVCLLHFVDLRVRFQYVMSQLASHLVVKMIGTMFLSIVLSGLLSLAFIIPGLIFLVRWFLYPSVVVIEGAYYMDALRRSSNLVRGNWWRLFGLIFIILVVYFPVSEGYDLMIILGMSEFYSALFTTILGSFVYPLMLISTLLFYLDVRVRKEGLTLETLQESIDLKGSLSGWQF